jgi:hypothetical protein
MLDLKNFTGGIYAQIFNWGILLIDGFGKLQ